MMEENSQNKMLNNLSRVDKWHEIKNNKNEATWECGKIISSYTTIEKWDIVDYL